MKTVLTVTVLLGLLLACNRYESRVHSRGLQSNDPIKQIESIRAIVARNRTSDIPQLIELLADDDQPVQAMASQALIEMTGQNFGFQPYLPSDEKEQIISRWRAWWNTRR